MLSSLYSIGKVSTDLVHVEISNRDTANRVRTCPQNRSQCFVNRSLSKVEKKLHVLKSRLSTLSSRVSSSVRRKVYKDVRTQTHESSNDMTTQTPRMERKDDVRVPTEPTPAASTTTSMTPKKRIEWIDNDPRYSVEDKDDVVVDVFRPEPSSLSFRTSPRIVVEEFRFSERR